MAQFYSVASTVDDALRQQREEERRAALDILNQKDVESQIAARDEASKMSALNRKLATGKIFLDQFGIGQEASPEDYNQAKDLGVAGSFAAPKEGMGPDFEGPMMTGETPVQAQKGSAAKFLGSPEEQATARNEAQFNAVMQSGWFDDPNVSSLEKAMVAKRLANLTLPSEYFKPKEEPGGMWVFDEATGKVSKAPGSEGYTGENKFFSRSRPPQPSEGTRPQKVEWQTADGKTHVGWATPGSDKVIEITGAVGMGKLPGSSSDSGGEKGVAASISTDYANALGKLAASSGPGRFWGNKTPDKDAAAQVATLRQAIVNSGVTPRVQSALRSILPQIESNPAYAAIPTTSLLSGMPAFTSLTPEEQSNVAGILSQVRGR